jgi:hypothetical protein
VTDCVNVMIVIILSMILLGAILLSAIVLSVFLMLVIHHVLIATCHSAECQDGQSSVKRKIHACFCKSYLDKFGKLVCYKFFISWVNLIKSVTCVTNYGGVIS